jgi:hypothetical protein
LESQDKFGRWTSKDLCGLFGREEDGKSEGIKGENKLGVRG